MDVILLFPRARVHGKAPGQGNPARGQHGIEEWFRPLFAAMIAGEKPATYMDFESILIVVKLDVHRIAPWQRNSRRVRARDQGRSAPSSFHRRSQSSARLMLRYSKPILSVFDSLVWLQFHFVVVRNEPALGTDGEDRETTGQDFYWRLDRGLIGRRLETARCQSTVLDSPSSVPVRSVSHSDAETQTAVAQVGRVFMTIRNPQIIGVRRHERATNQHAI